jgi:hypothetical protein
VCILKKLEGTEFLPRFKFTLRVRTCFAFTGQTEESVALTVKVNVPVAVVVPDMTPPALRLSPTGSVPQETFHVYGTVPPVAARTVEYCVPVSPDGRVAVPMDRGGIGVTVTVAVANTVRSATLIAVTTEVVIVETAGAVNNPVLEIWPADAFQVTAVLLVLLTVA